MSQSSSPSVFGRSSRALQRARERQRNRDRRPPARLLTLLVCTLAGLMMVVSGLNARGIDLRPGRHTDLVSLVQSQSRSNTDLADEVSKLRKEVDDLTSGQTQNSDLTPKLEQQASYAGLRAVKGPAVTVRLDDAPETVAAEGVDGDYLVVHQQDIQLVVNVFWAAGAEALTIQGQRVISTTGVKCVGNTVVLHGIPYAPPYVISAIGDPDRMRRVLNDSAGIQLYQRFVEAYGLVYQESSQKAAEFPAYEGSLELQYAKAVGSDLASASPSPTR